MIKRVAALLIVMGLLVAGVYVIVAPLTGLGSGVSDRADDGATSQVAAAQLSVNTLVAELTSSYQQARRFAGIVKARRSGDLSFSQTGRLSDLLVEQGQQVQAGDPLAELDTGRLLGQKQQLENARQRAIDKLNGLIAVARFPVADSMRTEIQALQSELDQLRAQITSETAPATQARLDGSQQRLDVLAARSRDPQVLEQQAVVGELSEQLAQLEFQIEEHTLRAPYDGSVGQRFVSVGTLVAPNVPIVRLVESDAMEVWFGLPADAVTEMRVGEERTIEAGGRALHATLHAKLPELEQSARTRTVIFSLDSSASVQVLPGDVARLDIQRRVDESGFWLPLTALTREARGLWSVYVLVPDEHGDLIVSRQYVEVMHLQGESARVRGALDDGALVVANGTHRVVPGQKVTTSGEPSKVVRADASVVDGSKAIAVDSP